MNRAFLALTLATLAAIALPNPFIGQASASDLPSATNVCGGHARSQASSGTGTLTFGLFLNAGTTTTCGSTLHYSTWAGATGTWTLTFTATPGGALPPVVPDGDSGDSCIGEVLYGNSATVHTTLFTGTTCPTSTNTYTASLTASGTYRIRLRVVQASEITNNYNLDTDSRSGAQHAGAIRVGLATVALAAGSYPAGSTYAYTGTEAATVTFTHTAIASPQTTTAAEVASINSGGTSVKTNAVTLSGTSGSTTFTVDDTYAASSSSYGATLSIPSSATSTLTGVRWTHIESATSPTTVDSEFAAKRTAYYTIDPRVTATHLLQGDTSFSTPPMSENDADDMRYGTDLGYVATRFTNARSEGLATSGFQFTSTLRDSGLVVPLDARSQGTALTLSTQGGEAGWSGLRIFNDGAPTGTWNKAVDVTAPSSMDADTHLISATKSYGVTIPEGGAGEGMGDPLKVFVSPLQANPEDTVRFAASEAFLDGTARTGNAADTLVYLYDPSGDLVVNGGATVELHDGIYTHTYTLNATPETGHWVVVIETTDPTTMDPVTTSNTFLVTNATSAADVASSLQEHRDNTLEIFGMDLDGLSFAAYLLTVTWGLVLVWALRARPRPYILVAAAATIGALLVFLEVPLLSQVTAIFLAFAAFHLEGIVGEKVYVRLFGEINDEKPSTEL